MLQLPAWNDTARTSWWKADLGELLLAGMEALGDREPSDRETLQEQEADAFQELHPDH